MTTIAWDGMYLAADTREVMEGTYGTFSKLVYAGSFIYGGTGTISEAVLVGQWLREGLNNQDGFPSNWRFDAFESDSCSGLALHVTSNVLYRVLGKKPILAAVRDKTAVAGNGCWFAAAAMDLRDVNAMQAVTYACSKDVYSGLPVDYYNSASKKMFRGVDDGEHRMPMWMESAGSSGD